MTIVERSFQTRNKLISKDWIRQVSRKRTSTTLNSQYPKVANGALAMSQLFTNDFRKFVGRAGISGYLTNRWIPNRGVACPQILVWNIIVYSPTLPESMQLPAILQGVLRSTLQSIHPVLRGHWGAWSKLLFDVCCNFKKIVARIQDCRSRTTPLSETHGFLLGILQTINENWKVVMGRCPRYGWELSLLNGV